MSAPQKSIARIFRGTPRNLAFLAKRLREGELVGVPTETVYGLAADALNARACREIFVAKGRPPTDPLIVHIHSLSELAQIAVANPLALKLAKKFWPGPLTLVLPKTRAVPAVVSAGLPSVAVRMPAHPLFRRLLKLTGRPLAAPSANLFGYISPTTAEHVRDGLGRKIGYILEGGAADIGLESTILDLRNPARPRLLRPGSISRKNLTRVLGQAIAWRGRRSSPSAGAQLAPGLLLRHYSPRTPLVLHKRLTVAQVQRSAPDEAWLFIARPAGRVRKNMFWLDPRGDLRGAAHRLFAQLRTLDGAGYLRIHVEQASGEGPADAINDRLRRAAAR
ncbi:MAG: threonylcarbamoyl-AMP synthase [Undibacterium sp.]|nr:threonylcarbamoyl-AMP synthase [Opitutaceae bacterium]